MGLTYDEIQDLMNLVDTDRSGSISYDEFISKMNIHIHKKSNQAEERSKEEIFMRIKSLLDSSSKSLAEIMSELDIEEKGFILQNDLPRVFKRLGMLHPEPHLKIIVQAGGYKENDEIIDVV